MQRLPALFPRLLAVAVVAAFLLIGTVSPAHADCSGPTLGGITGAVDRGAVVTITGTSFGDACNDVGPLPPGVRPLGDPIRDIEIVIAQGPTEVVVARGAANAEYEFAVTVELPQQLVPGEAGVWARRADTPPGQLGTYTLLPFVVSTNPIAMVETAATPVPTFGPTEVPPDPAGAGAPDPAADTEAAATPSPAQPAAADDGVAPIAIAAVVVAIVAVLAIGVATTRRRRATSSS